MRPGTILVVGYGNDLRGDDAAGRRAADRVDAWRQPGVEVRALHQLAPELAEPLAAATRAIFLDAHPVSDSSAVRVRRIQPAATGTRAAHTSDPQALLQLARTAFGRSPDTWWITIPGVDFTFGAPISALAERGVADALVAIRPLLNPSRAAADAVANTREGRLASDGRRAHRRNAGCPTR